jgi:hypothetical protein
MFPRCGFVLWFLFLGTSAFAVVDVESNQGLDFAKSDLILVGRVIGVQMLREADDAAKQQGLAYFGYYATVRSIRILKGVLAPDAVILIPIGGYWARADSGDFAVEPLMRNGGLHGLNLIAGGLYLLPLVRAPDAPGHLTTWRPRSHQASIIPINKQADGLVVVVPGRQPVGLDAFIQEWK